MRNLVQYPITLTEKILLLERLYNDTLAEMRVGDMRPLLLKTIQKDVEELHDLKASSV